MTENLDENDNLMLSKYLKNPQLVVYVPSHADTSSSAGLEG